MALSVERRELLWAMISFTVLIKILSQIKMRNKHLRYRFSKNLVLLTGILVGDFSVLLDRVQVVRRVVQLVFYARARTCTTAGAG